MQLVVLAFVSAQRGIGAFVVNVTAAAGIAVTRFVRRKSASAIAKRKSRLQVSSTLVPPHRRACAGVDNDDAAAAVSFARILLCRASGTIGELDAVLFVLTAFVF